MNREYCKTCGKEIIQKTCWVCGKPIEKRLKFIAISHSASTPTKYIHQDCFFPAWTLLKRMRSEAQK